MKWWHKALIASGVLVVLLAFGVIFMMQRIEREAISPSHRVAWENKLGQGSGQVFGFGLSAIWLVAWLRRNRGT
jgi:hypothetical protein